MEIKAAKRVSMRMSAFDRLGGGGGGGSGVCGGGGGGGKFVKNQVCVYWLKGRCNRNPCQYMHKESTIPQSNGRLFKSTWKNVNTYNSKNCIVSTNVKRKAKSLVHDDQERNSNSGSSKIKIVSTNGVLKAKYTNNNVQEPQQKVSTMGEAASASDIIKSSEKVEPKLCQYWVTNNCVHGDKCKDLHSWFTGSGFSMLNALQGHSKNITGITLPSGSDKLYSSSNDGSIRLWDCHSGQCTSIVELNSEAECLLSEGPWLFVGLQNAVKAWNLQTQTEFTLSVPAGKVCAMVVVDDILYAGIEGGIILAWRFSSDINCPELIATLKGHSDDVTTLIVGGANRLYSASKDHTIRVWDRVNMQCLHTLNGHSSTVTSLLCWDSFLLSGSLDNTLKVWAATESGNLQVVYELNEETGILALCGIQDAEQKPILLCSSKDNTVRLYDLPTFSERGRIFGKRDVHSIQSVEGGLFFTGDESGKLSVWKLSC